MAVLSHADTGPLHSRLYDVILDEQEGYLYTVGQVQW
jgi:hypothetical protein